MPDRGFTVSWRESRANGGCGRRIRFDPTPGADTRFVRIAEVWTGCAWRETDRELVRDVGVEIQAGGEVATP